MSGTRTHLQSDNCQTTVRLVCSFYQGQQVILPQDGWSNVHHEPVIASCIHFPGHTFLHDAVAVGDVTKDAEYCTQLAKDSIQSAEETCGCIVVGFVSDSEAKMVKVRENLQHWRGKEFIVYGCSAHYLNLVQITATPTAVKSRLVEIQKYFRNHQKPSAKLKALGGKVPQLPNDGNLLVLQAPTFPIS